MTLSEIIFCPDKDNWAIKINKQGIFFNREVYPDSMPDDFAKDFIEILEKHYDVKIGKKLNHVEWISVKDELPRIDKDNFHDYSEIVFVTDGNTIGLAQRFIFINDDYGNYVDTWSTSYYIGTEIDLEKVTHWMPLTKLPK